MTHTKLVKFSVLTIAAVLLSISLPSASTAEKLKTNSLIRNHLAAIGSQNELDSLQALSVSGFGTFTILVGGDGTLQAVMSLLSDSLKLRFSLDFDYPQYLGERIVFDGKKARISKIQPSGRSPLGEFLQTYNQIIREGLLGGCLSTAWPLRDEKVRNAKLKYRGLAKIDGEKVHRLSYAPRRGGQELKINLYFEQESFRHIRTEYKVVLRTGQRTTRDLSADVSVDAAYKEQRFTLTETFGDFQKSAGLVLPTTWKLHFSEDRGQASLANSRGLVVEYTMQVTNVERGASVNPKVFITTENPSDFEPNE